MLVVVESGYACKMVPSGFGDLCTLIPYILVILECVQCEFYRYLQRFDPGFGFTGGPYAIQPMYAPALNYNTEFPQLGSTHRPPISAEHQPCPLPPHLPGPWVAPSPPGIAYGRAETMIPPFNANHVGMRSNSALYLHSTQYPCQRPGMPFIHHHEQIQVPQPFTQVFQMICFDIPLILGEGKKGR